MSEHSPSFVEGSSATYEPDQGPVWRASEGQVVNLGTYLIGIVAFWLVAPALWALYRFWAVRTHVYELTHQRLRESRGLLFRRTEELELYRVKDISIEHPVVTKEALPITATAWCSPNRAQTWLRAMQGGSVPPAQRPTCDISEIERIVKVADELNVAGTPTVFLANGRRLQGAVPPDQFMAALDDAVRDTQPAAKP